MPLSHLNDKQQAAVLSENKRVLVLAGAGSGKTKTVITKLLHLIEEKSVKPSNILAITFTKNATNEMLDRLIISGDPTGQYENFLQSKHIRKEDKDNERKRRIEEQAWISKLTVKTFHSLCYSILRTHGNPVFDAKFKLIIDDNAFDDDTSKQFPSAPEKPRDIIHKQLILACDDKNYLLKLKRYILDYLVDAASIEKKMAELNKKGQRTYTTLKGDVVKSKSERDIADWFYRRNIKYFYEHEINIKDFNFKPDFYIPQADIYLEHKSNISYPLHDKEKQFQLAGKNCVVTYEEMMNNTNLFNLAMERIFLGKLTDAITEENALNFEEEFKSYHEKIKDFLKLVMRLQSMMKAEDVSPEDLLQRAKQSEHERVRVFYELAVPLLNSYKAYCTEKSFVDFDDLLILAIKLIAEHQEVRSYYQEKFKYVMVDEFQDVNSLQVKLLDNLITPETQLFCVGDDWQSIYGFRGSNVDYIVNFETYYKDCEVHKLNINYRSTQTIVGASNEVIKHNKNQISKDVSAAKESPSKIEIFRAKSVEDSVLFFADAVEQLHHKGYTKEDILVLYRRSAMANDYFNILKSRKLFASFKTIHASKGLEAKAVFILGLSDGPRGFPDVWLDDAIFRVVKDNKYDFLIEEERRLFYVAITRAKDELFLLTEFGNESMFIAEIPAVFYSKAQNKSAANNQTRHCPKCNALLGTEKKFCGECGAQLL